MASVASAAADLSCCFSIPELFWREESRVEDDTALVEEIRSICLSDQEVVHCL